jgi:DNA-directed RNA polymerase sigma subunit (sigma70/sigma32)
VIRKDSQAERGLDMWSHSLLADLLGISSSRVEQIEVDALCKIRDGLMNDPQLIGIMDELGIRTEDLREFER